MKDLFINLNDDEQEVVNMALREIKRNIPKCQFLRTIEELEERIVLIKKVIAENNNDTVVNKIINNAYKYYR